MYRPIHVSKSTGPYRVMYRYPVFNSYDAISHFAREAVGPEDHASQHAGVYFRFDTAEAAFAYRSEVEAEAGDWLGDEGTGYEVWDAKNRPIRN